jgi:hypothetical protein
VAREAAEYYYSARPESVNDSAMQLGMKYENVQKEYLHEKDQQNAPLSD